MKLTKRLIAFAVVAVMLVSTCIFASAAMLTRQTGHNITADGGVVYTKYSAEGVHTEDVTVLEFHPDDGYIALPFIGTPNSTQLLNDQYTVATQTYGYEVAGMVNAGFFNMTALSLEGIIISDGRIIAGQRYASAKDMAVFGTDGSLDFISSLLRYDVVIGGEVLADSIFSVNLNDRATDHNTSTNEYDLGNTDNYIYYYDSADPSEEYYSAGYQIICEKLDNTEISVGETLRGKVVDINVNTKGGNTLADNQFALYAKNGSTYALKLAALHEGDEVGVSVTETVDGSEEIMSNAYGVLSNLGVLVKDGVDLTESGETIGRHPMDTLARWTLIGIKADGTYVFFTSEGGYTNQSTRSLYLSDAAKAMIELGCVTVMRLDGGGSSGMYVSNTGSGSAGYVTTSTRAIADSLLIVKKSCLGNSALENELSDAVADAKNSGITNEYLREAIANAEKLIGKGATEGELRKALIRLSAKDVLSGLLIQCQTASDTEYSESVFAELNSAYNTAKQVYNSSSATDAQYYEQITILSEILSKKMIATVLPVASYTRTEPNYYKWDNTTNSNSDELHEKFIDDFKRLTDGVKSTADGNSSAYSAWTSDIEIVLDLGSIINSNVYRMYFASGQWGILSPANVTVSRSADRESWTDVNGELVKNTIVDTAGWDTHEYVFTANDMVAARYIKLKIVKDNLFVWMDEVEALYVGDEGGELHTHSYATDWSINNSSHWHACACGLKADIASHVGGTWTIKTPATLEDAGLKEQYCVTCNHLVATEVIPQLTPDHVHSTEYGISIHVSGHWYVCECGYEYEREDHVAGKWETVKAAGVGVEGKKELRCSVCHFFMDDEVIPALSAEDDGWILGDVNKSGDIDMMDYILLKRNYFGTFTFDENQLNAGDCNKSGDIDMMDYILLKRVYFGTFVLAK